ncbi:MAG: TrmH family RNA methyltransferase [Dongiaceae bacterium]
MTSSFKAITSLNNPLIKKIASLRLKKNRLEEGLFMAEGAYALQAALKSDLYEIDCLLFTSEPPQAPAAVQLVKVDKKIMAKLSAQGNANDVLGVFRFKPKGLPPAIPRFRSMVVLETIRDPGNLGSILRSAAALQVDGVVLLGESCDPYSPECVRASMGAIFSVPVYQAAIADFIRLRPNLKGHLIGAAANGTHYKKILYDAPVILLMGSEQNGLSPELVKLCDDVAALPMPGKMESLNVAVAAGIMLYEILKP